MLRNPYLNRAMIRAVDQFFGRRREVQRVMARIGAPVPQSVSIVGERRVGKSSLLWHLAQEEVQARFLEEPGRGRFPGAGLRGRRGGAGADIRALINAF